MRKFKLFFACLLMAVLSVGQMWGASFTGSNFSGQGVSGGGNNSAISATVDGVTYACTNGYGASATQFRCYKNSKVTISCSSTITAISFTFNGSYNGGLNTSYTNLSTNSWEVTLGSQARVTNCTVTVSSGDPSSPTISIAPSNNDFVNSVEVTLTPSEGATAYYTLDDTDPTNASTQYTVPFTLNESKTVKAIAIKGDASSEIVTKSFTKVTPMTVADALALTSLPSNQVFVEGIICSATEGSSGISTQYKNATYNISDDGTGVGMIVFRGKYLDNADVTDANKGKFAVGNKVIVCGNLTKYSNANQLAQNNYIVDLVEKDANPLSIAISGDMNVTEYALNATTLDYSGLTVKALYNTGYNPVVDAENIEWSFAPAIDEAGSKDITLTATVGTLSVTKDVTVTVADKELQSIAMQEDPYAPVVFCGAEMPKPTIIATFDNGTEDVTSACTFTEVNMIVPGVHTITITYTYGEVSKTAEYQLTVNPYSVEEIQSVIPATGNIETSVEGVIRWIDYVNADGFAKYSISATGSKDDTDTLLIYNSYAGKDNNGYVNFATSDEIELGDKVIVSGQFCTYGSNNLKETVTKKSHISSLTKKEVTSIAISGELSDTEYQIGQSVSASGLKVTATYNTGYQQEVTSSVEWSADPETFTAKGDEVAVTMTASYLGQTDSKNATVKVVAPKADANLAYNKSSVELTVGETFEPAVLSYADGIPASEISYESDKESVAQVAADGTVTLVENAIGIATITATFAGNDDFNAGSASYLITVNEAAPVDLRSVATASAFTAISGDMTPADITFAAYKGDGTSNPVVRSTDNPVTIRLYKPASGKKTGGYITVKAKVGCTIDQVKVDFSGTATASYSVNDAEFTTTECIENQAQLLTPTELDAQSVSIVNLKNNSIDISEITVYYTGEPLAVDHYFLGGTYSTEFMQYGTFNYEGLEVYAAYDAEETIKEAVTGFTVEADLNTFGQKKAYVYLNEVKIAEYDITVTESPKEDPALAYTPSVQVVEAVEVASWEAPAFSNTFNVSPITYSSNKPAVATVDENGVIALAGGYGTAVITATFAETDAYIASVTTYTITVNEPVEDLSGTWIVATSVAAGDRIIIGATYQNATLTMGKQNSSNRAAIASDFEDAVLTPAEGTKTFTLVDAGEGKFALRALNGKYLTSATTGTSNNLLEADNFELDNAKWTISINEQGVASVVAAAGNRTYLKYNPNTSNNNPIFSCYQYSTSQQPINIYKIGTPDYGTYNRDNLTIGNYGTICLPKKGTIAGATLFEIADYKNGMIYCDELGENEEMVAGRPYIFLATATELNVTYTSGIVAEEAGNANGLHGFYNLENENAQFNIPADAGNYILYQNQYWLVSGRAAYIANYRAYIKIGEINSVAPAPGRRRVAMNVNGEQTATGINELNATEAPVKMIMNGQLYILRGEKLYNANGQIVK